MEFYLKRSNVKDIVLILIGTFLMSVAINSIYDPLQLVTGGVTGIGIIIKYLGESLLGVEIPIWLTNLLCNVPLFIISFKVFGFRYISKTFIATLAMTVFLYILPAYPLVENDYFLGALFGGILSGAGIGLVLLTMSTTGGTDMLGMLIHHKFPYYSVPRLLLVIDGAIVIGGAVAFGLYKALYSIVAVYIVTKVSDGLLEGLKFAKSAYIVSPYYREIADEILYKLDRGVTALKGTGMYSDSEKNVLFCVVSKKEIVSVLDIVYRIDPQAFVTINDVREVRGEGFTESKR